MCRAAVAGEVGAWIAACAEIMAANRQYLTALDAAIGDADHGANMHRGFDAVMQRLGESGWPGEAAELCRIVGLTLLSTVGGASGPLYGTFFVRFGAACAGISELGAAEWATALDAAVEAVLERAMAEPGDKTMLDALLPARDAMRRAVAGGADLHQALAAAAGAAEEGMRATTGLVARRGGAGRLGQRSLGHQDPGATSAYLVLKAAADVWA